ncbi:hypothetical protein DP804_23205 [Salmonella enterica subsp. enterica]|nr:hypothetical protein [Salmonella enterica subsp. enterica serovar Virchow]
MKQHAEDYHLQCEDVKLFIGSYGVFDNWEIRRSIVKYEDVDSNTLDVIESLLIYAHQPSYNSSKLCRNDFKNYRLRLFNTGKRKALLPEISTEYWNHRIV